jgi:hypothetical protein
MRRETPRKIKLRLLIVLISMIPALMAVSRCYIPFGMQ